MTQQEHLTTEQLSAFLDKQLTPQEQAFFDAHLQSCQRCQNALAELRRTVALLHAMPQPQLPRSFTLPATISKTQTPRPQPQPARQGRVLSYTLRRTVRAVSTLAAAVAVIFILSGLLANVHLGGGESASTGAPVYGTDSNGTTHSPAVGPNATKGAQTQGSTPKAAGTPNINGHHSGTPKASSVATPTPIPTSTPANGVSNGTGTTGPPTLPPALDLSQPAGRLTLGALLLLLSIAGFIATRRRRRNTVS
ncbi:MAG: anti-sigma factor family protein [Ktedonobacteraceae bacterium]